MLILISKFTPLIITIFTWIIDSTVYELQLFDIILQKTVSLNRRRSFHFVAARKRLNQVSTERFVTYPDIIRYINLSATVEYNIYFHFSIARPRCTRSTKTSVFVLHTRKDSLATTFSARMFLSLLRSARSCGAGGDFLGKKIPLYPDHQPQGY